MKRSERQFLVLPIRANEHNRGHQVAVGRRELQLARMISAGHLNKQIAYQLGLTTGTVKCYLTKLFMKLGAMNRADLSAWAVRHEPEVSAGIAMHDRLKSGGLTAC
jgi:DNA-binding NarL/FixJ family response regulator